MRQLLTHRPCGACHALVPVFEGCEHWLPAGAMRKQKIRERSPKSRPHTQAPDDSERVDRFLAMMNKGSG